jgi:hypothetical protein
MVGNWNKSAIMYYVLLFFLSRTPGCLFVLSDYSLEKGKKGKSAAVYLNGRFINCPKRGPLQRAEQKWNWSGGRRLN